MACSRKSIVSGYNHISRRFQLPFLHILHHDRENSKPPEAPAPAPISFTHRPYSSNPFDIVRSAPKNGWKIGLPLPLGVDQFSRRYSSSTDGSNEICYINDAAEVLTDASMESGIVNASTIPVPFPGEVAAAAADSFLPVAALQHLIDGIHSFTGLNWWASIVLTTLLIRGITVPLLVKQLKATMKLNAMRPEMEKLKEDINNNMNPETLQENQKRMKALFKKHGVTPFTPLKGALIQGPIFISFFMAISNMVEKVPSFKGGGAYWFTDLTTPDAMYIFPILTASTFLIAVELNMQEGLEGNPIAKTMKNFFRVLGLMTIPFTAHFPKAIFCYWVTSNLFSLAYGFAIKRPPVRKFLDLPAVIPQPSLSSQLAFSFGGSKSDPPASSSTPEKQPEESKSSFRKVSSSTVLSQRLRSLEKAVKARNKPKKREESRRVEKRKSDRERMASSLGFFSGLSSIYQRMQFMAAR